MKYSHILAALAVVASAGSTNAADWSKKTPGAVDYVKVADAYGNGFFYIPGTDTALKIGGYVQAQYAIYGNSASWGGLWGWQRNQNGLRTAARVDLNFDARTNTELGLLRSYIDLWFNNNSYGVGTGVVLKQAFIQFGGLTAGRATSFFDFFNSPYVYSIYYEAAHSDANANLLAYTFSFGNGVSASLSVEDPSTTDDNGRRATYLAPYGGVHSPDLITTLKVDQAWGSAQVGAVLHDDLSAVDGVNSRLGYALSAGVKINVPTFGVGDQIALQVGYTKGATGYIGYLSGTYADFGIAAGNALAQNTAWAVATGFTHGFTKSLSINFEGSYAQFRTDTRLANGDFNQIDTLGALIWEPVKGLKIIGEVEYENVKYDARAGLANKTALVNVLRVRRSF